MPDQDQLNDFLEAFEQVGSPAKNPVLREALGWEEPLYEEVKAALVARGIVSRGRGRSDSAVQAMGDTKLKVFAAELITQVTKSVSIDWTVREGARARIRVMVKRILNKYGDPPDLQEEAVKTVLAQAELLRAQ